MLGGYGGGLNGVGPSTLPPPNGIVAGYSSPYPNKYGGRMDQLGVWYGCSGYPTKRMSIPHVIDRVQPLPVSVPPPPQVVQVPVPVAQPVVTSVVQQPVVTSVVQQPLVTSVAQPVATGVPTSTVISSTVQPLPPMV